MSRYQWKVESERVDLNKYREEKGKGRSRASGQFLRGQLLRVSLSGKRFESSHQDGFREELQGWQKDKGGNQSESTQSWGSGPQE